MVMGEKRTLATIYKGEYPGSRWHVVVMQIATTFQKLPIIKGKKTIFFLGGK